MTKAELVIAISCSDGDPRHPKTWSGTPSNITKAIESLGINVFSIDASIKRYQRIAFKLLHRLAGLGTDYLGGPVFRAQSAKITQRQIQASGCTKILHTSQLGLPMPTLDAGVDHYLVCDTTRVLWTKFASNVASCTPKMLRIADQLEWESYAQIKHFFPISEYVRDNLIHHYGIEPHRITVVGTGRGSIQPFTGEKDYKNGPILFVAKGRFEDKGGSLLIEGFKLAQKQNPSLKIVVVGDEQYRDVIGPVPNVTVTGYIPWEELQHLFNTAALFAMPALNEPWGLVYLEALACKTPILGLNRNSLPEITRDGQYGFLVNEPSPERIAEEILQAFSSPDKLREMGAAGQKHCLETYSWNQVATKIVSVMLDDPISSLREKQSYA